MRTQEIIDRLTTAAPRSMEWCKGEKYGAYNIIGNMNVDRVLYCVTPTDEVCDHFRKENYDLLVSHHPFIAGEDIPQVILHTALDCCEGGLNDQWRDILGIKNGFHFDGTLGWAGEVEPISFPDLMVKVENYIDGPIMGGSYCRSQKIESIVVCTGLGGMVEHLALRSGAECYLVGEMCRKPQKSGFNSVIEVGHTLTEYKPGILFVQKHLPGVQVDGTPENDYYMNEVFVPKYYQWRQ